MLEFWKYGKGKMVRLERTTLLIFTVAILVLFHNRSFFRHLLETYEAGAFDSLFVASVGFLLACLMFFLLNAIGIKKSLKPVLILVLLVSAVCSYFYNAYGVIIDTDMVRNAFETNSSEAFELFSLGFVWNLILLGVIPALVVAFVPLKKLSFRVELVRGLRNAVLSLGLMVLTLFGFNRYYTSFFREHKPLRYYANPVTPIYSLIKYMHIQLWPKPAPKSIHVGEDAAIPPTDPMRELVILVVGEAARADHFQLNGYERETNPRLSQEEVISFQRVRACGTSTAISVPCMFSFKTKKSFSVEQARATENVLDVMAKAGVHVLWRDNNSDSKGVAVGLPFEDFRTKDHNPDCDIECRDLGMLDGLNEFINEKKEGDILIVLHQMGNHGPAYFQRYPESFEVFEPACRSNQLQSCSRQEIINAYDNALVYTDYFLSKVIEFLKGYDQAPFETAMIYIADHGESLGEGGLYLHGVPNIIAPSAQTHVPAIFWFGKQFFIDRDHFALQAEKPISHENLVHTLLGLFEVDTHLYESDLDLSSGSIFEHTATPAEW